MKLQIDCFLSLLNQLSNRFESSNKKNKYMKKQLLLILGMLLTTVLSTTNAQVLDADFWGFETDVASWNFGDYGSIVADPLMPQIKL